jgi:hypothetical protein
VKSGTIPSCQCDCVKGASGISLSGGEVSWYMHSATSGPEKKFPWANEIHETEIRTNNENENIIFIMPPYLVDKLKCYLFE